MDNKELLDSFWGFATERQLMFDKRRMGFQPPWTQDEVLSNHRFTNAYRANDRVSQYLIREVQYTGSQEPEELVFRTLVFKLFNQIETWKRLCIALKGQPSLANWDVAFYNTILTALVVEGVKIWNNAYMITPPLDTYGGAKHTGWLHILDSMWKNGMPQAMSKRGSLREVYETLIKYPTVGKFFAFQWTIDLNYTTAVNFDEDTFVVAGPGAVRGATKLFGSGVPAEKWIDYLTRYQEPHLEERGLPFRWLGGIRRLHLIDVQNLLCEWDKYTRVALPELVTGTKGYDRIKQRFDPYESAHHEPINYWYPPKWGVNDES